MGGTSARVFAAGTVLVALSVGAVAVAPTGAAPATARHRSAATPHDTTSPTPTATPTTSPSPSPSDTPTPSPSPAGLELKPDVVAVVGALTGGTVGSVTIPVLANDVDHAGGKLLLVSVTQPVQGSAAIVNNKVVVSLRNGWRHVTMTYRVATTTGESGKSTITLTVLPPPYIVHTTLVQNHETRGVGTLLTVKFSRPIQNRAVVQAHLAITSTKTFGFGAWAWRDASTVQFRPYSFWPGHATITVQANLAGVTFGKAPDGRPYQGLDTVAGFTTARSMIATINAVSDLMVVRIDGKVVRTMGVSLGKPGFTTRSGIKVVAEKYPGSTL